MEKQELVRLLKEYGDAIVNYRSENSRKLKYNVCTLDFSTPYIKNKKNRSTEAEGTLLVFCWDSDSFKMLKHENVTSVLPLSAILKNTRHG
jgi:hypothetical protein